jgi:hypothetical protein
MFVIQLTLFVFIVLFAFFIDKTIRKRFDIPKQKGLYKQVNAVHKWGEIILLIIYLLYIFLYIAFLNQPIQPQLIFVFLILLYIFRSFMEWKYEKASKRYILSISTVILIAIVLLLIEVGLLW